MAIQHEHENTKLLLLFVHYYLIDFSAIEVLFRGGSIYSSIVAGLCMISRPIYESKI
jgi:hypothetical protein